MQALDAVYKRGGSAALMCAECDHNKAADAVRQWGSRVSFNTKAQPHGLSCRNWPSKATACMAL